MIKNCYLLLLIGESLDWLDQIKQFISLISQVFIIK